MADEAENTAAPAAPSAAPTPATEVTAPVFEEGESLNLESVYDIPVEVSVVLGKTAMSIDDLLNLGSGSVIELERKVGEPVDLYINERLVARGEVVIVEDNIGITMTEVIKVDKS